MANTIKATNELLRLAESMGSVVCTKRLDYYYFPFWIEKDPETNKKKLVRFENLPEEVRQYIQETRDTLSTPEEVLKMEVNGHEEL
jgi:hypothetical protein